MLLTYAIVSVILLAQIKVILKPKRNWILNFLSFLETVVLHLNDAFAKEGGGVEMLSNIYQLSFLSDKQ